MTTIRRVGAVLALVVLGAVGAWTQTGILAPMPRTYFPNAAGAACSGCKVFTYAAGTTTKLATYSDAALTTPNTNPIVLDPNGTAAIYLNPTLSYKFVLAPSTDTDPPTAAIMTQDNIIGPYSGVLNVTAADPRGLRATRTGADAGLSLTSIGGSGKTYGLVSMTTGALRLQDDSDSTPRLEMLGNNITHALTGTFTIDGGVFATTGFGSHAFDATGTGEQVLRVRNTSNNSLAAGALHVGNDTSAFLARLIAWSSSSSYGWGGNTAMLAGEGTGGLVLQASHASGVIRFASGGAVQERGRVLSGGRLAWLAGYGTSGLSSPAGFEIGAQSSGIDRGQIIVGDGTGYSFSVGTQVAGAYVKNLNIDDRGYVTAPRNAAFLAVNSATDANVLTGATVDFDSEIYDVSGSFAADVFTAPVAGVYEFCASIDYADNAASEFSASINIGGVLQQIGRELVTTAGGLSGCTHASMSAGGTASVSVTTTDTAVDILGSASPRITWFSGRLVQ